MPPRNFRRKEMKSQDSNFIRIDRGENLEMIRIDTFEQK
ncbi:hypothetical protein LEP1GSC169_3639 [Leptospira santarosai str. HAI1349]|nr:hypothetical protein LEP1GSC169_3639 [Leptospira santarosai str. HAI1349]